MIQEEPRGYQTLPHSSNRFCSSEADEQEFVASPEMIQENDELEAAREICRLQRCRLHSAHRLQSRR
uniref:Uncharacterized protein n=1 Tax=Arabidopsis thaliana TaxID=3702 RepID=Q8GY00_ARATH|nr:unknown protein [Arabidopsis thaliana]